MADPYVKPQVIVQFFGKAAPAALTEPMRACVVAPHAYVRRLDDATAKSTLKVGTYDPDAEASYLWPGRPAGAIIDPTYTEVRFEKSKLVYFEDLIGADEMVVPTDRNRVFLDNGADEGFAANGAAYPRFDVLLDRDVTKGDKLSLRGVVAGDVITHESYVLDLDAGEIAAAVGAAVADAGNEADQAEDIDIVQSAGTTSLLSLTADLSNYNGLIDGSINEVYTVEVTASSVGGVLSTAVLKLTSASGDDNESGIVPGNTAVPFIAGARGLSLTFTGVTDLLVGQKWTVTIAAEFSDAIAISGGTYTGALDTTYIVEVVRGGFFNAVLTDDRPYIVVRSNNGYDNSNGSVRVDAHSTAVACGTKGVTVRFSGTSTGGALDGLVKGALFSIPVTSAANGAYKYIVLGHDMPEELLDATDLDLRLWMERTVEIPGNREGFAPLVNWETSATELTVKDGIVVYDPSWTEDGVPQPLIPESADIYVQYRAWLDDYVDTVGVITADESLSARIAGVLSPDNPLMYGLAAARANAGGSPVYFSAVSDPDSDTAWQRALDRLIGKSGPYSVVACSNRRAVANMVTAHATSQSSDTLGRYRITFVPLSVTDKKALVTGTLSSDEEVVMATLLDDPDTSGTQYSYLQISSGNASLIEMGVTPGDEVRFLFGSEFDVEVYETFVVDAVISETAVRLVTGHSTAISVPQKVEFHHPMTTMEMAQEIASQAGSYSSTRVRAVWPDTYVAGGQTVEGYFLCCALAGLRSSSAPHQPLTNVEVIGVDSLPRTKMFNEAELDVMAAAGTWIVDQNDDGSVYNRHALTTDMTDINTREDSIVTNMDSIKFFFRNQFRSFIGRTNATDAIKTLLFAQMSAAASFLSSIQYGAGLGPQMENIVIDKVALNVLFKDQWDIEISGNIPGPSNRISIKITA